MEPQQNTDDSKAMETQPGPVTMNTQQKDEYRMERYRKVLTELRKTSFTTEKREMLARALSKMYEGIPLCTYTYSHQARGDFFKNSNDYDGFGLDGKWKVLPSGIQDYQSKLPEGTQFWHKALMAPTSPFVFVPEIPFSFSEGTISRETSTEVTFSFPLDTLLFAHSDPKITWLAERAKWVVEFTVDSELKTPITMKFLLAEPVKKLMRYSFNVVDIEMKYSFLDNCQFHAMTSLTIRIEGSTFERGNFEDEMRDSYTEIECEQPLVYLLPNNPRLSFLDHIF